MSISEKIKTIDNKIKQNKAQYYLGKQTAKISALLSGNVSKLHFLTNEVFLPEKHLLENTATMKRFEYSPLEKELKKQTSVAEKSSKKLTMLLNLIRRKNSKQKVKRVVLRQI